MANSVDRGFSKPLKKLTVQLNGDNCILCLRKVSSDKSIKISDAISEDAGNCLKIVPKAVTSPGLLSTFNLVWRYVRKTNGKDEEEESNQEISFDDVMLQGNKKSPTCESSSLGGGAPFSKLPTLCLICAHKVLKVENLMEAVRMQVKTIQNIITDSMKGGRYSWRMEEFEMNFENATTKLSKVKPMLEISKKVGNHLVAIPSGTKDSTATDTQVPSPELPRSTSLEPPAPKRPRITYQKPGEKIALDKEQFEDSTKNKNTSTDNADGEDEITQNAATNHGSDDEEKDPDYIKSEDESDSYDEDEMSLVGEDDEAAELPVEIDDSTRGSAEDSDPLGDNDRITPEETAKMTTDASHDPDRWKQFYVCTLPVKCISKGCVRAFETDKSLKNHLIKEHPELVNLPFKCSCGSAFLTEHSLKYHCRKHCRNRKNEFPSRKESQKCDLCGKIVLFKNIIDHLRSHVGDYVIKCPNPSCHYAFSNSMPLSRHCFHYKNTCMKFAPVKGMYTCEKCEYKTKKRLNLRCHLKEFHERELEKPFSCPFPECDEKFVARQSVDFHLATHSLIQHTSQRCKQCSKYFEVEKMTSHLKDEHQVVGEILKCPQCPFVFPGRTEMIEHMFDHRFNGLLCDICGDGGVKFLRHSDLCQHYADEHQIEVRQYSCEVCNKKFGWKEGLQIHNNVKHRSESTTLETSGSRGGKFNSNKHRANYSCDLCLGSVSYVTPSALVNHKIKVHGEEPFRCKICGETFDASVKLSRHEKEHAGMKFQTEFKCEVENCGRVFASKKSLNFHVKGNHNGEKNICSECGKTYSRPEAVKIHMETVHLGLRSRVCELCGETFKGDSTLKNHMLVHTGERPFACPICDQRFRQKVVLTRHLQSHEEKGADFKPNGPMKHIRKRLKRD